MLGKVESNEIQKGDLKYLGPTVFSAYNVVMIFFILNIYISIITDSFDNVRYEAKTYPDRFDFMEYSLNKIKKLFKLNSKEKKLESKYVACKDFSHTIDRLTNYLIRVNKLMFYIFLIGNK
jgi:hypothetical protein